MSSKADSSHLTWFNRIIIYIYRFKWNTEMRTRFSIFKNIKGQITLAIADWIAIDDYKINNFLNSYD